VATVLIVRFRILVVPTFVMRIPLSLINGHIPGRVLPEMNAEDASETLLVEVRKILIEIRTAKQRAQKRQPRTLRTRARTQKKQQPTFGSTQPYFYVSISVYEELTQSLRLSFAKTKNAFEMIGMRRRLVTLLRGRHFRVLRRFGERQRRK